MKVDQTYCINDYWMDYPREDKVRIDSIKSLSADEKNRIRKGETIQKSDRGGTYVQYYKPMFFNDIVE